jgi:hypothetical protein
VLKISVAILTLITGWLAPYEAVAQPLRIVAVIDAVKFPPKATQAHDQLRSSLEEALSPKNWFLAHTNRPIADCGGTTDCMAKVATDTNTQYVLRISGQKTRDLGYDVTLDLFTTATGSVRSSHVTCDLCDPGRLSEIASQSTAELLTIALREEANMREKAKRTALPPAEPPPATVVTPPSPAAPPPATINWMPWALAGVGAVVAGYGIWALYEDGKPTGAYSPSPAYETRNRYSSQTLGIVTATGGGLLVLGGAIWGISTMSRSTTVSVSLNHVALNVRF